MLFTVAELHEGKKRFDLTYQPGEFSLEDERADLAAALKVIGEASLKNSEVRVKGDLEGSLHASCDRCLRSLPFPVSLNFDAHYIPVAEYEENERAELQDDDLEFSVFDGEKIDLDELIREQILLALPVRLLCQEECKGLCPECGSDLNHTACQCEEKQVDPRWDALAALKKRE